MGVKTYTWPKVDEMPKGAFYGQEDKDLYTDTDFGDAVMEVVGDHWGDELPDQIVINVMVPDEIKVDPQGDILDDLWDMMSERYVHPDTDLVDDFDPKVVKCAEKLAAAIVETFPVSTLSEYAKIVIEDPMAWLASEAPEWLDGHEEQADDN